MIFFWKLEKILGFIKIGKRIKARETKTIKWIERCVEMWKGEIRSYGDGRWKIGAKNHGFIQQILVSLKKNK